MTKRSRASAFSTACGWRTQLLHGDELDLQRDRRSSIWERGQLGALDAARAQRIRDAFDEAENTPGTRLVTPLVLETIARAN